jgi:hypothetical protein
MTLNEASKKWGVPHTTIKQAAQDNLLILEEIDKSEKMWLVSSKAMDKYFGTIIERILDHTHTDPKEGIRTILEQEYNTVEQLNKFEATKVLLTELN